MGKRKSHKQDKRNSKRRNADDDAASEDMDDEIDAFHRQRDVIPLDINGDAPESDEDAEHPVFNLEVPKSFLLEVLGKDRVTKFVIQEILNSTMADYAKKENINVKDKKVSTSQTADELKMLFNPGKDFGFNAILELESAAEVEN